MAHNNQALFKKKTVMDGIAFPSKKRYANPLTIIFIIELARQHTHTTSQFKMKAVVFMVAPLKRFHFFQLLE